MKPQVKKSKKEKKTQQSVLINSNGIHLDGKKLNKKKMKEIQIKSHLL